MSRTQATADVFQAIAEPSRRQLLHLVAANERSVTDLVAELGVVQPLVSKHLRVLREVGVVHVRDDGRRRLYRLDADALRPVHDWLGNVESLWAERFGRMESKLGELVNQPEGGGDSDVG
jgi:DNA-binding transcriptional ArsR family regulator